MDFPFGETVYVRAYLGDVTEDAHGNTVESWAAEPGVAVEGCAFSPGESAEPVEANRRAVVTTPQLFCPPDTVITSKDIVTVRDLTFQVVGDPADWTNPFTGWRPGVVVNLRRVSG